MRCTRFAEVQKAADFKSDLLRSPSRSAELPISEGRPSFICSWPNGAALVLENVEGSK